MTTSTIRAYTIAARVTDTLPEHWKYVSEGGATIVFSYVGPPDPHFNGTVLRLRKSTVPGVASQVNGAGETQRDPDDPMIEYQQKCMERLIPVEHLPRLQSVHVDRRWLESLVTLHDTERPQDRRVKGQVDLTRTKGVLATDVVGSSRLAVEIKPKWAFLPSAHHLSDITREVKMQTCRFCMHSAMRTKAAEIVATKYCPLDLFSGDEGRVKQAICDLWDAWTSSNGAINNLKIFVEGKTIAPREASLLLSDDVDQKTASEDLRETFVSALLPLLLHTPVLRVLSTLQRNLDVLDIEGLSKLWRLAETSAPLYRTTTAPFFQRESVESDEALPPSPPIGVSSLFLTSPEPAISEWTEFLDMYLSDDSAQLNHTNPTPENLRYYLLAYLLSATFKDCSIIVRLHRLRPTPPNEVKPEQVTVIDLDPKSMARLRKWERLDQEIVQAYLTAENRKVCIDGWR
ncbi:putative phosphorylates Ins(1,3,4,5,6)P5 at position 2 to form Ins(1,2,3,4,5,6)P6 (InsP6 or phytate) [Lyophyllum shimeji]|uniref:Inositol-pentakisphosphate 2-kinase n=1 Tax=Lyophyllum shimeji TaxID=47721 RepID=A0A9P3PG41_LYOSH|nr:putative phosphorylates Ins(1,3,4,5,6)P5 at position 2 to form Ins(1,2,3,4,5,6)P6 (InsP6 or phytate) [Lyophyllum shimeji]